MTAFLEDYRVSEDTLKKLYDSRLRLAILDSLEGEPLRLADLRRKVGANAPNTSAKAKDLEGLGLVERVGGEYRLTQLGAALRAMVGKHLSSVAALESHKDYWLSRRLDFIPPQSWSDVRLIKKSEVVKSPQLDTTYTHDNFAKLLMTVKKGSFKGISPIYHKDYMNAIKNMVANGIDIELVVTPDVAKEIVTNLSKEEAGLLASYPKIKVYLYDRLDSGISVSDSFIVLCLVSKTDIVSLMDQYLYSEGPNAVKWGTQLFDYYKNNSKLANLQDFL